MSNVTRLPWPTAGDTLFTDDAPDWQNNACLNFGMGDHGYMEGFRLGADSLVHQVEEAPVDQDFLVYPIVFSYRQYLELRLKELRRAGFELHDWPAPGSLNHKLPGVWADCRKLIEVTYPTTTTADLDAVETIINEFDTLDPDSFAFRYAKTKKSTPSLPAKLRRINLRHLRDTMRKMAVFLDAAAEGIAHMLDDKRAITP